MCASVMAAHAAEPGMIVGMRSGSPPGKWMTSAAASSAASPASAAICVAHDRNGRRDDVQAVARQRPARTPPPRSRRPGPDAHGPPRSARRRHGVAGPLRLRPAPRPATAAPPGIPRHRPGTRHLRGARPGHSFGPEPVVGRRHVLDRRLRRLTGPAGPLGPPRPRPRATIRDSRPGAATNGAR